MAASRQVGGRRGERSTFKVLALFGIPSGGRAWVLSLLADLPWKRIGDVPSGSFLIGRSGWDVGSNAPGGVFSAGSPSLFI
jgi:hypothetical protein